MNPFFKRWFATTIGVLAAAQLPGIRYENWIALVLAALMLGILNAVVRPLLLLLSLPLILLTLGFFILIVNALILRFVAVLVPGFHVHSFGSAFIGAIVISIVSWFAGLFIKENGFRVHDFSNRTRIEPEPEVKQADARVIEHED